MTVSDNKIYKCTCCGEVHENPVNKFYKSTWSQLWNDNDKYCSICKKCLDKMFDDYSRRYKSDKIALMICCHYIDLPFYNSLYDSIVKNNSNFSIGMYSRQILNNKQYQYKTFINTLVDGELSKTDTDIREEKEVKWSKDEIENKKSCIEIVGYDPFEEYDESVRRVLFNELIKYFENDDDIADDTYKISQVIQIVNNNNQIRHCDITISSLNPVKDAGDIKTLNEIKSRLVASNDKIAKENEISVKNRSNKEVGKSTLGYLQRNLREINIKNAEENYYDQLRSDGTLWAVDMSTKAIYGNALFDENDKQEIYETNLKLVNKLQTELDDALEKKRLLQIEFDKLKEKEALKDGD